MTVYEYKVVPAPRRPRRVKGVRGTPERYAHMIEELLNEMGADGWSYLRSDSMPVEARQGMLKGRIETYQTVMVFMRPVDVAPDGSEAKAQLPTPPIVRTASHGAADNEDKSAAAAAATAEAATTAALPSSGSQASPLSANRGQAARSKELSTHGSRDGESGASEPLID